jgi:hypothetical protein
MSISSLRWRAASAFITLGAAAAVLALAVPAGASTGTTEISPEQAGYTATGAQFKVVFARVYPRQPGQYSGEVAGFGHSVQLWSSSLVATVGITTTFGFYTTYATIYDRSTHQVIASNPNAVACNADGFCGPGANSYDPGFTVTLSISYSPADGHLIMTANSDEGSTFTSSYTATAQSFTEARVGTDFGSTPWDGSYSHTPPAKYTKIAAFSSVALTTYSGHTSTLWSWWVHHPLLANTGQQSGSDWVAIPTDLTNGGASFQTFFVPQSGQGPAQPVLP